MAGLKPLKFARGVSGATSLCMRLRGKMEKHYEKNVKGQVRELNQPEASIPSVYKSEFRLKNKDIMYREIYQTIDFFDEIIREALTELKEKPRDRNAKTL